MKADKKTESAVMAVINGLNHAYAKRDLKGVMAFFADDADVRVIGTGADEKAMGHEAVKSVYKRDIKEAQESAVRWIWHHVSGKSPVAWFAGEGAVHARVGGKALSVPVRMTAVLEERNGKWLLVQTHSSMPAANQPKGKAYPKV